MYKYNNGYLSRIAWDVHGEPTRLNSTTPTNLQRSRLNPCHKTERPLTAIETNFTGYYSTVFLRGRFDLPGGAAAMIALVTTLVCGDIVLPCTIANAPRETCVLFHT